MELVDEILSKQTKPVEFKKIKIGIVRDHFFDDLHPEVEDLCWTQINELER